MSIHTFRFENSLTKRYYRLVISEDLFGDWIVTKIWGGIGKATGRIVHVHCETHHAAMQLIESLTKIRKKRGYESVNISTPSHCHPREGGDPFCKNH